MKWRTGLALLVALLAAGAWFAWRQQERTWLEQPIEALRDTVVFEVPEGASLSAVAASLDRQGLLAQAGAWVRHARREGLATRIKAGEYELQPGTTPAGLLEQFVAGRVRLYAVTIPEGWTFRQALAAIQSHPAVRTELAGVAVAELTKRLGLGERHPEGLFFPDTYHFPRGTSDGAILLQAHARMENALATAWANRDARLPLESPYQALILASLIEKETGAPDERGLISGVFVNRLRKGMRLQTDPTVIYGMGDAFDGNLRRRDLLADTPYNTYTRAGLPPTPIALPGRDALEAAVRPARTDALYFVATGLGDGRHFFAKTLVAHNANVQRHLANLRGGGA
ncbi:MAG TPA: endolytic transglycosylase MltG [Steroidobacteraceae bacterium]|nr:endolytic transglycosylase MltG [Steroidobacteraceae bacterium]